MPERETYFQSENSREPAATPYVVSADIELLMRDWSLERGFILPESGFFRELRRDFTSQMVQLFPGFELVTETELADGIADRVQRSGLFPISLDGVYYRSLPSLDITRLVNEDGQDAGLGKRPGSLDLLGQFRKVREEHVLEVVLVDDVIYSGDMINRTRKILQSMGMRVSMVCAGIGIEEGIEKLNGLARGIECVRRYKTVIDEVCERDFYPGVPMSGRTLLGQTNVGAPYLLPFGNPEKWASIPQEKAKAFSRFCITQSISLFAAIEETSGRSVLCSDLDRKVLGLPFDNRRFKQTLESLI